MMIDNIFKKHIISVCLTILYLFGFSPDVQSQIIELAVGQGTYLYTPDAPYPYTFVSSASWDGSEAPNIGFAEAPNETYAHVGVRSAFSGLQKITCYYICSGFINGHVRASPPLHKTYYIRCVGGSSAGGGETATNYSETNLPNTITISVGQKFDLSPYTNGTTMLLSTNTEVASIQPPGMLIGEGPGNCVVGFITATQSYGCNVVVPEPDMALVLWNYDGTSNTLKFKDKPNFIIVSGKLMIQGNGIALWYPLNSLERISLIDLETEDDPSETSGIKSVEYNSANIEFDNNEIRLMNCPAKSCVSVYAINGIKIGSYNVTNDGKLCINLSEFDKGAYILNSGFINFKFVKK